MAEKEMVKVDRKMWLWLYKTALLAEARRLGVPEKKIPEFVELVVRERLEG